MRGKTLALAALALSLFTSTSAHARPVFAEPSEKWLQVEAPAVVVFVDFRDLANACGEPWLNGRLLGCEKNADRNTPCKIVVPNQKTWPGSPEAWAANLLHEQAHCNGWPANHTEESKP